MKIKQSNLGEITMPRLYFVVKNVTNLQTVIDDFNRNPQAVALYDSPIEAQRTFSKYNPTLKENEKILISATYEAEDRSDLKLDTVRTLEDPEQALKDALAFGNRLRQRLMRPPSKDNDPQYIYDNRLAMSDIELQRKCKILVDKAVGNNPEGDLDFAIKILKSTTISPVIPKDQLSRLYDKFHDNDEFNRIVFESKEIPHKTSQIFAEILANREVKQPAGLEIKM